MSEPELSDMDDSYRQGYIDALKWAGHAVVAAPTSTPATVRIADGPGCIRRVLDRAVDPDGDPNVVYDTYALRDFVLAMIDDRLTEAGFDWGATQ